MHHSYWTGSVIQNDHRARAQPTPGLLHRFEIHRHIQALLREEFRRCPSRNHAAETITFAHAPSVVFNDLAQRRAHRKLPPSGPTHPTTCSKNFRPSLLGSAELL